jgi:acyl-CoA synthetase (AMP-forming)/AMP-acid ligase II
VLSRCAPATLERFAEAFASVGVRADAFCPTYGLAEATLMVSGTQAHERFVTKSISTDALRRGHVVAHTAEDRAYPFFYVDARHRDQRQCTRLVGNGRPEPGLVYVRRDDGAPCGAGELGEIWIAGPSVSSGYWDGRGAASRESSGDRQGDGDR